MPPLVSCAPTVSKPPTSSPCQQCREMGIASSAFRAASVSTPRLAYCSFAVWYVCVSLSSFIKFSCYCVAQAAVAPRPNNCAKRIELAIRTAQHENQNSHDGINGDRLHGLL